jgi:predicted GIY-YIG superfamily endonuclease
MDATFANIIESLDPQYRRLLLAAAHRYEQLPRQMPKRGIYLFSEGPSHLYVGRTNRLRERLRNHCQQSGTHFTATFAFRIARHESGKVDAAYTKDGSRQALMADPRFARAFRAAKERVRKMDIRYVQEEEPTRQALLEIYVATVLNTPFNDFDTH